MELDVLLCCACVAGEGKYITVKEISGRWGYVPQTVWNNIQLLVDRGLINKVSHGKYTLNTDSFFVMDILSTLRVNNGLEIIAK